MNITYTQNGDYLIPNIVIRKTKPLGRYGRLRKAYLEMHRPILFNELVLSDKLFEHCAEIEEAARNRMELIVRSLAEQNGVTEQLKAENQMEWVRQMNACKAQDVYKRQAFVLRSGSWRMRGTLSVKESVTPTGGSAASSTRSWSNPDRRNLNRENLNGKIQFR